MTVCVVFNLCHGVDVEATREKMKQYRKDHQSQIMKNREKQVTSPCTAAGVPRVALSVMCRAVTIGWYNLRYVKNKSYKR